jgi:hypothetical protein
VGHQGLGEGLEPDHLALRHRHRAGVLLRVHGAVERVAVVEEHRPGPAPGQQGAEVDGRVAPAARLQHRRLGGVARELGAQAAQGVAVDGGVRDVLGDLARLEALGEDRAQVGGADAALRPAQRMAVVVDRGDPAPGGEQPLSHQWRSRCCRNSKSASSAEKASTSSRFTAR